MAIEFEFIGGSRKLDQHSTEKFFLFFIVGGREVPHYQMLKNGLIEGPLTQTGKLYTSPRFRTYYPHGKIFTMQRGFGMQMRYYSFYFELLEPPAPTITIFPFSGTEGPYVFKAQLRFLPPDEVVALLDDGESSKKFIQQQQILPMEVLRKMVTVNKETAKQGVRVVRVGKSKKEV